MSYVSACINWQPSIIVNIIIIVCQHIPFHWLRLPANNYYILWLSWTWDRFLAEGWPAVLKEIALYWVLIAVTGSWYNSNCCNWNDYVILWFLYLSLPYMQHSDWVRSLRTFTWDSELSTRNQLNRLQLLERLNTIKNLVLSTRLTTAIDTSYPLPIISHSFVYVNHCFKNTCNCSVLLPACIQIHFNYFL